MIPFPYVLRRRMMISGGGLFPSVGTPLSDWTWEQIVALSNSGTDPRNYFSVGDEKDLILTTSEVVPVVIGDFYHNTITGTETKAAIAFTFKNCLNTTYDMNSISSSVTAWDGSKMRKTHMINILNTFPDELRVDGAIKAVDVVATATDTSIPQITSSDKLRLHSLTELSVTYGSNEAEGTQYPYYSSETRVKTVDGIASNYWTRSLYEPGSSNFLSITENGGPSRYQPQNKLGVACCFDI